LVDRRNIPSSFINFLTISNVNLLIKQADNDGRLALIPDFLETDWSIDVVDYGNGNELKNKLVSADAMISMNWSRQMPDAPQLKLLHLPGAGTDDIAFDAVPPKAAV